jgi:hypothetical protein
MGKSVIVVLPLAAAALAVLSASAAHAQSLPNPCPLPPVEYDHPFRGTLILSEGHDQATMHELCRAPFVISIPACIIERTNDTCTIALADDKHFAATPDTRELIVRHEIGHCNGWPPDHRGARPINSGQIDYCEWKFNREN